MSAKSTPANKSLNFYSEDPPGDRFRSARHRRFGAHRSNRGAQRPQRKRKWPRASRSPTCRHVTRSFCPLLSPLAERHRRRRYFLRRQPARLQRLSGLPGRIYSRLREMANLATKAGVEGKSRRQDSCAVDSHDQSRRSLRKALNLASTMALPGVATIRADETRLRPMR